MPVSATPNSDLALWIAGLGFLSSLAVVAINSYITLKSKEIDARIKKDEQAYGFRMEYYKRKLNAGEKAIGKLSILLTTLEAFKSDFKGYLENEESSEGDAKVSGEDLLRYQDKFIEATAQVDDYFYAYFVTIQEDEEYNRLMDRLGTEQYKITYLVEQFNTESDKYFEEHKDTNMLTQELTQDKEFIDFLITEYIKTNDEFQNLVSNIMVHIHEQMKEAIHQI